MTICIAATCQHHGKKAVVLCADYQTTRGDYVKADDTYKLWHFHEGCGTIGWAGDNDVGVEFARRFMAVAREFHNVEKSSGDGDVDIRIGKYLASIRKFVSEFMKERIDHAVRIQFGIGLQDYYAMDAARREPGIRDLIKSLDLGAEFLIIYFDLDEPLFFRIEQNGYALLDDDDYVAIGSGEPLAAAVFSQITEEKQTLPECLTYVCQAKLAAENNPFVGRKTTIWLLMGDKKEFKPTDETWEILGDLRGISLSPVDQRLIDLGDKLFKEYQPDDD